MIIIKKFISLFVVVLLFFSFVSCTKQSSIDSRIANLSTSDILADNLSALNSHTSQICVYGDCVISLSHSDDGTDSVVCGEEVIYKHDAAIQSIKAVDNRRICLYSDDVDYYLLLDLETGKTEKTEFSVSHEYEILRAEPYFIENAVYIVASIGIEGQGEPSAAIYCKAAGNDEFTVITELCMFYQILPNGVLFSNDGETVTFVDTAFNKTEYNGFSLEKVFSVLCGSYQLSVANSSCSYTVTDIFSGETVYSSATLTNPSGLPANPYITENALYFIDSNGIQCVDFQTDTCTCVIDDTPDSFVISNGKLYYQIDNTVKCVDL